MCSELCKSYHLPESNMYFSKYIYKTSTQSLHHEISIDIPPSYSNFTNPQNVSVLSVAQDFLRNTCNSASLLSEIAPHILDSP